MAAVGLGATIGTGTVTGAPGSDGSLGAYRKSLRSDLTDEGLPPGEFVYGDTEQAALEAFALSGGDKGSATQFDVSADVPITKGVRVDVNEDPANAYSYSFKGPVTDRMVSEGDVLLAVVYLRGVNTANADTPVQTKAGFKYKYTNPDGSTGYSQNYVDTTAKVSPPDHWKRYYFPIEITEKPDGKDFSPFLEFWTGYGKQTIEFGGMALVSYDQSVSVGDLPTTARSYDYPGRAEDAEWREAAHERIEEIRKTDFEVRVVDADRNPIEGATVDVAMQEHAFGFGSAVSAPVITGESNPDNAETYRQTFLENFNKAVFENSMKVPAWEGRYGDVLGKEAAVNALDWMHEQDIPTRGHALLWATYDWMGIDPSLSDAATNAEVKRLIRERADFFEGELVEWDMLNHPLFYPEIWKDLGKDALLEWSQVANESDTVAQMYTNELGIIAGDSLRQDYDDLIGWLLNNGASVEGIGFMGHFGLSQLTPPTEILSTFDQFAEHGVPLQVTEFDIQINDRSNQNEVAVQRDYLRDLLTAAFSHEALEGVMSWGFWAPQHWRPTAAYYNEDWTLRPHGEEYRRLVLDEWWTDIEGSTDSQGVFTGRGFKGKYEITVDTGTATTTVPVSFDGDGVSVEVQAVDLDVKSTINPRSQGVIPVQIEGTTVSDLDLDTVRFGTPEAVAAGGGAAPAHTHETSDGTVMLHFPNQETGIESGDSTAQLIGETTDGTVVFGVGDIRTTGPGNRKK
jgi:endo-1,4-beta-xylanase